jgi:hypothetical protein
LEEGSYCDDELMAEYLGGVLASSYTPDGRDDRGAMWASLVASMSSIEVRAHYLMYREWAALLHGRTDLDLGVADGRAGACLVVDLDDFVHALVGHRGDVNASPILAHVVPGLVRRGLLAAGWHAGGREMAGVPDAPWERVVVVQPEFAGFELYGWAMGEPDLDPFRFAHDAEPFETEPAIARLAGAYIWKFTPPV